MRKLWLMCGRLAYWLSIPALKIYLGHSERTRVLVIYDEKVLVTKAWLSDGKWSLPGGGLHKNEQPLDGMMRELWEETGVVLKPAVFKQIGSFTYRNNGLTFPYYLFNAEISEAQPLQKQRLEITELAWLSASELSAHNAAPDVLQALKT